MTANHLKWQRIDELFARAVELPPDEREPFVRDACADDTALYAELVALLDSDRELRALRIKSLHAGDGGSTPARGGGRGPRC